MTTYNERRDVLLRRYRPQPVVLQQQHESWDEVLEHMRDFLEAMDGEKRTAGQIRPFVALVCIHVKSGVGLAKIMIPELRDHQADPHQIMQVSVRVNLLQRSTSIVSEHL